VTEASANRCQMKPSRTLACSTSTTAIVLLWTWEAYYVLTVICRC